MIYRCRFIMRRIAAGCARNCEIAAAASYLQLMTAGDAGAGISLDFGRSILILPAAVFGKTRGMCDGQGRQHQNQTIIDGRYRLFLRHVEECADEDGKAELQEVRSGRQKARRIQRDQDQVIALRVGRCSGAAGFAGRRFL
jgi:hypothetical protein